MKGEFEIVGVESQRLKYTRVRARARVASRGSRGSRRDMIKVQREITREFRGFMKRSLHEA